MSNDSLRGSNTQVACLICPQSICGTTLNILVSFPRMMVAVVATLRYPFFANRSTSSCLMWLASLSPLYTSMLYTYTANTSTHSFSYAPRPDPTPPTPVMGTTPPVRRYAARMHSVERSRRDATNITSPRLVPAR